MNEYTQFLRNLAISNGRHINDDVTEKSYGYDSKDYDYEEHESFASVK